MAGALERGENPGFGIDFVRITAHFPAQQTLGDRVCVVAFGSQNSYAVCLDSKPAGGGAVVGTDCFLCIGFHYICTSLHMYLFHDNIGQTGKATLRLTFQKIHAILITVKGQDSNGDRTERNIIYA